MSAIDEKSDRESRALWEPRLQDAAVEVALQLYGAGAVTAAAWCALTVHCEENEEEFRFWFAVFTRLQRLDATPVKPWPGHRPPTPAGTLH